MQRLKARRQTEKEDEENYTTADKHDQRIRWSIVLCLFCIVPQMLANIIIRLPFSPNVNARANRDE